MKRRELKYQIEIDEQIARWVNLGGVRDRALFCGRNQKNERN